MPFSDLTKVVSRARAYLATMPPAITGSGGDNATFKAALVLVKGFALDDKTSLQLLKEWNHTHCQPPWVESALRQKIASAGKTNLPTGYLLRRDTGHAVAPRVAAPASENEQRKAWLRSRWPKFSPLTRSDITKIAELRRLPLDAVGLSAKAGYMAGATVDGHPCFVMAEDNFVQARRFDGDPFNLKGGKTIKAKNLPGCDGAFIGKKWCQGSNPVLLVEGAIGLLEAVAIIILLDRAEWVPLAATSASSRFERDSGLRGKMKGRRVCIVPDGDEAGWDAAAVWLAELETVGATVESGSLPVGCKDLGDVIAQGCFNESLNNQLFAGL